MKMYVANYNTVFEFETEIEDPTTSEMSLEHFSSPQVSDIGINLAELLALSKAKSMAELHKDYCELDLSPYIWSDGSLNKPKFGRSNLTSRFINPIGGEVIISVVIQEMEI